MSAPLPALPTPAAHPTTDEARAKLPAFEVRSGAPAELAEAGRHYLGAGRDLIHALHRAGKEKQAQKNNHERRGDAYLAAWRHAKNTQETCGKPERQRDATENKNKKQRKQSADPPENAPAHFAPRAHML